MARRPTKPVDADPMPLADAAQDAAELPQAVAEKISDPASSQTATSGTKTGLTLALGAVLGMGGAALGYGAALQFPLNGPQPVPVLQDAQLAELAAKIGALDLSAIESRLAALEAAPQLDAAALQTQITTLQTKLASLPATDNLRAEVADLAAKVAKSDPAPAIKSAIAAEMAAVQKAAQDMAAAVADAAKEAQKTAALTQLRAAMDTGGPYLAAAQALTLPEVLAQNASAGIPSLNQLRDGFADAARAGLDAALRADMGQTWGERVTNFLKNQTGARSLIPREGGDPDAILSRVEAGLRSADLPAALGEALSLPEPAKLAMQGWIAQLQLRVEALAALDTLTDKGM